MKFIKKNKSKANKVKKRKPSKEEIKFKRKFYELMFELDLYNKFKRTYLLEILNETNYGYFAHIYLVPGLSFDDLQDKIKKIEQNLKCLWVMKTEPFKDYGEVQIVLKPIDKNIEYKKPKIKPNELYLGMSFSNQVQKNDNNKNCMFLLGGATGSGKTRYMYLVLLSWILNCSHNDVWIFLSDIAKNEYIQFKNVVHVKYYAAEIDELYEMMKTVSDEFERRKRIISQYREKGIATNIEEYNKINKSRKLPYCYIMIDEFSVILPDAIDSKEEKKQKQFILDVLKRLAKLGRSVGIFTFMATQKTTRDEIPSILKNMSAVRISFRANDLISSEVIMGDNSATGLPDRVAVYSLNGGSAQNYLYTPKITMEKLKELLKPYIVHKPMNKAKRVANDVDCKTKIIRIPKGVNGLEYLKSLKNKDSNKEVYNDYGS